VQVVHGASSNVGFEARARSWKRLVGLRHAAWDIACSARRFVYHARLEHTIPELQAQIDRLNQALQKWQQAEQDLQPLAERLSHIGERGSEILNRLAAADTRQAHAVSEVEARLGDWNTFERRVHEDSLDRIRALERTIEQEWKALRDMHAEPLRQLREQAAALGETCVATANLSLRGYERAEARLAALETDLRAQLTQIAQDVHSALAELKGAQAAVALPAPAAVPFPLDRVMRIHDDLRGADQANGGTTALTAGQPLLPDPVRDEAVRQLPAAAALSERVDVLERELTQERQEVHDTAERARRLRRDWWAAVVVLVSGIATVFWLGYRLQQQFLEATTRAAVAENRAADADRQIATARAETAAARDTASRAEFVSRVLAAPDLLRIGLVGVGDLRTARGQIMWSRSNGFVMTASRLPPAAAGSEYQVWLRTPDAPIRVGVLTSDASGRGSLVTPNPSVPRPVDGASVTLEPAGAAGPTPLGEAVLVRPVAAGP
jgi:hypothetical protein